jgi:hypothetical protein
MGGLAHIAEYEVGWGEREKGRKGEREKGRKGEREKRETRTEAKPSSPKANEKPVNNFK